MAPNPFAKAAEGAKVDDGGNKGKKPKEVFTPDDPSVRAAIDDFVGAKKDIKESEAVKDSASATVVCFGLRKWLGKFAEDGAKPESFSLMGDEETVLFISQDRSGKTAVTPEQKLLVEEVLGRKAKDVLVEQTEFSFNTALLNEPGVMDALGEAINELAKNGVLTEEQVSSLLVANTKTVVKKGTLDRLSALCNGDAEAMEELVGALGSNATHYLK